MAFNDYRDANKGFPKFKMLSGLYPLNFTGNTPNIFNSIAVAGTISSAFNCAGYDRVVLAVEFSAANVTAKFRIILIDWNDNDGEAWSWEETSLNTGDQTNVRETGYYHGEMVIFKVTGAKQCKVYLSEVTNAGSVSVWGSAI